MPEPVIDPAPTPSVTGTPRVGTTLHVSTGAWMDGVDLGYQWLVAGLPVTGATDSTYRPRAADLGKTVRVQVSGTRAGYPTVTHQSADTAPVAVGELRSSKPTISGKAMVGKTLKAKPGSWTAGTTFSYAWYADGIKIKHQKGATLKLTKARKGAHIKVKVTGTKAAYTPVSRTSSKTAKVRRLSG